MRTNVATVLNGERIYTANVNEYIHSIVPSLPEQVPFCQADAVAKLKYLNLVSNPSVVRLMAKRKVKYMLIKERLSCSCDGFLEPSSHGAHVVCGLADHNLERIRRLFGDFLRYARR